MSKNVVLCLDGTGNQVKATGNTNVLRLYGMLDHSDPSMQVAFYDPGVGTAAAPGAWSPLSRWFTRMLGLAFGFGVKANLGEAYRFLMRTYEPGDQIFVFGFSRGSYTARALSGLTTRPGLMRLGAGNLVPYLVSAYTRGGDWERDDWVELAQFAHSFVPRGPHGHTLPLRYLGLWDTVKAMGHLRRAVQWPYTRKLPNAARIAHAVSLNEVRRPYAAYLVERGEDHPEQVREVWFAGVHSDVGGTFPDDHRLADITLRWMLDDARANGLLLTSAADEIAVAEDYALGEIHRMGWVWGLLGYRHRRPPDGAHVHRSVAVRMQADPAYRLNTDVDQVVWDDPTWPSPPSSP